MSLDTRTISKWLDMQDEAKENGLRLCIHDEVVFTVECRDTGASHTSYTLDGVNQFMAGVIAAKSAYIKLVTNMGDG